MLFVLRCQHWYLLNLNHDQIAISIVSTCRIRRMLILVVAALQITLVFLAQLMILILQIDFLKKLLDAYLPFTADLANPFITTQACQLLPLHPCHPQVYFLPIILVITGVHIAMRMLQLSINFKGWKKRVDHMLQWWKFWRYVWMMIVSNMLLSC